MKTSMLLIGGAIVGAVIILRRQSPGIPVGDAQPAAGASPLGPAKRASGATLVKPAASTETATRDGSWWASVASIPTKIARGVVDTTTTAVKGIASPGPIASSGPGKSVF